MTCANIIAQNNNGISHSNLGYFRLIAVSRSDMPGACQILSATLASSNRGTKHAPDTGGLHKTNRPWFVFCSSGKASRSPKHAILAHMGDLDHSALWKSPHDL